jgi:hypothetical protein
MCSWRKSVNQPELEPTPVTLDVRFADASNLPLQHVNAVSIRFAKDEFFIALGVVIPPDPPEIAAAQQVGYLEAQPVFRFAMSRDTMEKFLALAAGQYDQQSRLADQLNGPDDEKREGKQK